MLVNENPNVRNESFHWLFFVHQKKIVWQSGWNESWQKNMLTEKRTDDFHQTIMLSLHLRSQGMPGSWCWCWQFFWNFFFHFYEWGRNPNTCDWSFGWCHCTAKQEWSCQPVLGKCEQGGCWHCQLKDLLTQNRSSKTNKPNTPKKLLPNNRMHTQTHRSTKLAECSDDLTSSVPICANISDCTLFLVTSSHFENQTIIVVLTLASLG